MLDPKVMECCLWLVLMIISCPANSSFLPKHVRLERRLFDISKTPALARTKSPQGYIGGAELKPGSLARTPSLQNFPSTTGLMQGKQINHQDTQSLAKETQFNPVSMHLSNQVNEGNHPVFFDPSMNDKNARNRNLKPAPKSSGLVDTRPREFHQVLASWKNRAELANQELSNSNLEPQTQAKNSVNTRSILFPELLRSWQEYMSDKNAKTVSEDAIPDLTRSQNKAFQDLFNTWVALVMKRNSDDTIIRGAAVRSNKVEKFFERLKHKNNQFKHAESDATAVNDLSKIPGKKLLMELYSQPIKSWARRALSRKKMRDKIISNHGLSLLLNHMFQAKQGIESPAQHLLSDQHTGSTVIPRHSLQNELPMNLEPAKHERKPPKNSLALMHNPNLADSKTLSLQLASSLPVHKPVGLDHIAQFDQTQRAIITVSKIWKKKPIAVVTLLENNSQQKTCSITRFFLDHEVVANLITLYNALYNQPKGFAKLWEDLRLTSSLTEIASAKTAPRPISDQPSPFPELNLPSRPGLIPGLVGRNSDEFNLIQEFKKISEASRVNAPSRALVSIENSHPKIPLPPLGHGVISSNGPLLPGKIEDSKTLNQVRPTVYADSFVALFSTARALVGTARKIITGTFRHQALKEKKEKSHSSSNGLLALMNALEPWSQSGQNLVWNAASRVRSLIDDLPSFKALIKQKSRILEGISRKANNHQSLGGFLPYNQFLNTILHSPLKKLMKDESIRKIQSNIDIPRVPFTLQTSPISKSFVKKQSIPEEEQHASTQLSIILLSKLWNRKPLAKVTFIQNRYTKERHSLFHFFLDPEILRKIVLIHTSIFKPQGEFEKILASLWMNSGTRESGSISTPFKASLPSTREVDSIQDPLFINSPFGPSLDNPLKSAHLDAKDADIKTGWLDPIHSTTPENSLFTASNIKVGDYKIILNRFFNGKSRLFSDVNNLIPLGRQKLRSWVRIPWTWSESAHITAGNFLTQIWRLIMLLPMAKAQFKQTNVPGFWNFNSVISASDKSHVLNLLQLDEEKAKLVSSPSRPNLFQSTNAVEDQRKNGNLPNSTGKKIPEILKDLVNTQVKVHVAESAPPRAIKDTGISDKLFFLEEDKNLSHFSLLEKNMDHVHDVANMSKIPKKNNSNDRPFIHLTEKQIPMKNDHQEAVTGRQKNPHVFDSQNFKIILLLGVNNGEEIMQKSATTKGNNSNQQLQPPKSSDLDVSSYNDRYFSTPIPPEKQLKGVLVNSSRSKPSKILKWWIILKKYLSRPFEMVKKLLNLDHLWRHSIPPI